MFSFKSSFSLPSAPNSQKGCVSLCQIQQHLEASYPAPSSSKLLSPLLPGPPTHRCCQLVYFWHIPSHIGSKHNKTWLVGRWKHLPLWVDSATGLNQGQNLAKDRIYFWVLWHEKSVFCLLSNRNNKIWKSYQELRTTEQSSSLKWPVFSRGLFTSPRCQL